MNTSPSIKDTKKVRLGINTGFAVNRFPEPSVWPKIVGEYLDLRYAQFTADLLNPALPASIIKSHLREIRTACRRYRVSVEHTFTSAFTRVNHLASPDPALRRYWLDWFKKFIDISAALGARSMGSHFGILTATDVASSKRRKEITEEAAAHWQTLAAYAKNKGLEYLTWEPMSIRREFGETIGEARRLHKLLNNGSPLPIKFCLDVDHGDLASPDPRDTNPYAWLAAFAKETPIIHLKQSLLDKGGHYPFLDEYNQKGKIMPGKIMAHLQKFATNDTLLLFELSFREREPHESNILAHLKTSVNFWRPYIKD